MKRIQSDETMLVQRARQGCRRSFARLWNVHAAALRAVVVRWVPRQLVDDVVQDVALAALAGIGSLRGGAANFAAWLRAIAHHRACTLLARQRRRLTLLACDEATIAGAPAEVPGGLDGEQRSELRGALRRLPPCYRQPLRLRFLLGLSPPEIAARLGMTHGSVRVSLCRALRRLRADFLASGLAVAALVRFGAVG